LETQTAKAAIVVGRCTERTPEEEFEAQLTIFGVPKVDLDNPDYHVRCAAVKRLAAIDEEMARDRLIKFLSDQEETIQKIVHTALILSSYRYMPPLISHWRRWQCIRALPRD